MKILNYTAIFQREPDGGYVVRIPALDGCTTEGDSFEEAKAMALDAIQGYIECLIERNLPIPVEDDKNHPIVEHLQVAV